MQQYELALARIAKQASWSLTYLYDQPVGALALQHAPAAVDMSLQGIVAFMSAQVGDGQTGGCKRGLRTL